MHRMSIVLLALGCFLVGTAELVVAGILNEVAKDLHISLALAGQFITAYSLAFAIGTPILVTATSRTPRKKLLTYSMFIFILGSLASFFSMNYMILMASRVVLGLSAGVYCVVALSSVAKIVPPNKIGSAIGMIALAFGSAMTLGVPIGIALAEWWSWQAMFLLLAVGGAGILVGMSRLLPQIEGDEQVSFRQQLTVLRNPVITGGLMLSLLICIGNSVMLTYLTPFLQSIMHLNVSGIGIMMSVLGIVGMIGSRVGGAGVDRLGTRRMISYSLVLSVVSLALLPLFTTPLAAGLLLISVWTFTIFTSAPALQTFFIQQAPESANFVLSLNISITHLGLALGAAAGGLVVSGTSTVLYHSWIASFVYAIGLLLSLGIALRQKQKAGIAPASS